MERLTEQNPSWIDDEFWISAREPDDEEIDAVYLKLKAYEDIGTPEEFAALKKAQENGKLVELPLVAMVEQCLVDGKFKVSAKAQAFNGRYAVVYTDPSKWGIPLIDICGSIPYRREEADARVIELKAQEEETANEH